MRASPVFFVTGASGYLGRYLVRELQSQGVPFTAVGRTRPAQETHLRVPFLPLDLADLDAVEALAEVVKTRLDRHAVVLHAGALSNHTACERDEARARRINVGSSARLAAAADTVLVSTDLVFGEHDRAPYATDSTTAPQSLYGSTKAEAEEAVLAEGGAVARLPLLFGPSVDGRRGATDAIRSAQEAASLFTNEFHTPLHVADAAAGLIELCLNFSPGSRHHLAHRESLSRYELGQRFVEVSDCNTELIATTNTDPRRPRDVSLIPTWTPNRSLDEALAKS